ncbi:calmodulin-regulated spectrin-associated protein 3-like [Cololabis saira]|uniref:calmodulin-regulated spectrin-associated protein 3-like n=1 Tax=Cololabis saira TaxID=129043 RepID=UPI002AD53695|nr:calmodulin-regulated spectrin-associated protein 3-like [Cololabis saira]
MDLVRNKHLRPQLRDDEALLLENAVRLAVDSVLNALCGLHGARAREYERTVAERDREIQRLQRELQGLRARGCACAGPPPGPGGHMEPQLGRCRTPGPRQEPPQGGHDPGMGPDGAAECEMRLSLGVFARPPSRVSSFSHESAPPSSPSRPGSDQTSTSRSSEADAGHPPADPGASPGASPGSPVVKEEPCDINAILIEWEMSEERLSEQRDRPGSPLQDRWSPGEDVKLEDMEGKQSGEKPGVDPGGSGAAEGEPLRSRKRSVRMSDLPEEAQRLKRAAWRAASRRYYARKMARQKGAPSRPAPFAHILGPPDSHAGWFTDSRRRAMMAGPPDAAALAPPRDAWRPSPRRHHARRAAPHQTEQDLTRGGGQGDGPHAGGGGILCS